MGFREFGEMGRRGGSFEVKRCHGCHFRLSLSLLLVVCTACMGAVIIFGGTEKRVF